MTSPEKLRKRQLMEGAALIFIGVLIAVQSIYFNMVDRGVQQCIATKFSELSYSLDYRDDLASRETTETKELWLIYAQAAGLLKDNPEGELTPTQQRALQKKLIHQLLEYQREITKIERDREANPLPPYPVGTCKEG